MRFAFTEEQADFAASLDSLLTGTDTVAIARAWAAGDHDPGLKLWERLAEQGVNGLIVPEDDGGMGATRVELAIAFEALGRHAVPGPWVDAAAYLPRVLTGDLLAQVAAGAVATVAGPESLRVTPYALDADAAALVFAVAPATVDGTRTDAVHSATIGERVRSIDPTRRLFPLTPITSGGLDPVPLSRDQQRSAYDHAALATAAQLLGAGERLLADSVSYVKQRTQFGRPIGSYQAIKHQLADVRISLDFARPLLYGAALSLENEASDAGRDVSAAKVACGDAAYLASRVALQVHGAIGYTREFELSLWILKVRALVNAWGTPGDHRARVLESLGGA